MRLFFFEIRFWRRRWLVCARTQRETVEWLAQICSPRTSKAQNRQNFKLETKGEVVKQDTADYFSLFVQAQDDLKQVKNFINLYFLLNPQAPVAQKVADEVIFRRFQGVGVALNSVRQNFHSDIKMNRRSYK